MHGSSILRKGEEETGMRIIPGITGDHILKKYGKMTALILVFVMLIQLTACGGADAKGSLADEPGHGKWIDSDLMGSVKADDVIRPQDDFAAAENQETITSLILDPDKKSWSSSDSTTDFVYSRYREVLEDESITGANAEVLRTFEDLVLDWDKRNKLGVEPLRKYVDDIQSISSIEEMTAYQASLERNPFNLGLMVPVEVSSQIIQVDKSMLKIQVPDFTLSDKDFYKEFSEKALEAKEYTDNMISYMLGRLGYDEPRIKEILKGCYEVEQFLANNGCTGLYSVDEQLHKMQTDRAGLESYENGYPLTEILDGRGYSAANSFYVDYMLLGRLSQIYDLEHLNDLKSYLTVKMLMYAYSTLDREALEKFAEIGIPKTEKDPKVTVKDDNTEFAYNLVQCSFMPAMDTLYLEKYYPDDTETDKIREFIDGLKIAYGKMVYEADWLSDETKAAVVEKLNNMVVQVVRPTNTADYSTVKIKGYDEGGTILDAAASASRLVEAQRALRAADPDIDRGFWDIYDKKVSTTTINSLYYPDRNCFYILAGWVANGDNLFGEDISYEEFLGCVGSTVGHEISHGFDSQGSRYDLYGRRFDDDGVETDWMSTDDRSRLDERVGKVGSYFSLARPIPGKQQVTGYDVQNEAAADISGIGAILYMARDIEDFDYDGFFRGYAALWATQKSEEDELDQLANDAHPLNFYRINITLQQFDEFLDTYDIKPGDGMYLEPGKRVNVW